MTGGSDLVINRRGIASDLRVEINAQLGLLRPGHEWLERLEGLKWLKWREGLCS